MSKLDRVIVPMPQFVNPNNAKTNSGSINLSLDAHPVEHAEGYGSEVSDHVVHSPADANVLEGAKNTDEWTKDDYKKHLAEAGLPVSGNKDELQTRWEHYEAQEAAYKEYDIEEWEDDIDQVESVDDLASLRAAYDRSGADDEDVVTAFEAKSAELEQKKEGDK